MDRKYKKKLDLGDDFDSMPPKKMKQEELEVTGVSRSGRVRKKSSKLMDFESPDEIDIRANRKKEKPELNINVSRQIKKPVHIKAEPSDDEEVDESSFNIKEERFSDDSDMGYGHHDDSSLDSLGSDVDDLDDDPDLDRDEPEGFQPICGDSPDESPGQAQSLYMLEKSRKKLVIKDGRIVGRMKTQRKDKGKTRFTAYMLWAKEIRQELLRSNPELDFSQTSKKLGELWATVPYNEKYIWKRRAKRLAAKGNVRSSNTTVQTVETGKKVKSPPGRKFINKQQASQALVTSPTMAISSPTEKGSKQSQGSDSISQVVFKPVGTTPLDVAAHLRLLGESLTIVGERLTEHEGQIAVSGSFSVFLDSLLCALVSLLCLTQQVPEMNVIPQEQLSQAMDNIAYIMPGL